MSEHATKEARVQSASKAVFPRPTCPDRPPGRETSLSEPEARGARWTEERAERGTSEHATKEARVQSASKAERETQ